MSERDEIQALWAEQTTNPLEVDMERIEAEAGKFERGVRRRNGMELAAGALVALAFGTYAVLFDHPLARGGAVGVVVGVGIVVAAILRRGREAPLPHDGPTTAFLAAYRAALLRQARLLTWVPVWYVLPIVAPAMVFAVGVHAAEGRPTPWGDLAVFMVLGGAVSALNLYGARKLRRKAEALA